MFPFSKSVFAEPVSITYQFQNLQSWKILIDDQERAVSGREQNTGQIPINEAGNHKVKLEGMFNPTAGSWTMSVNDDSQSGSNPELTRDITIPGKETQEQYRAAAGFSITYDYTNNQGGRGSRTIGPDFPHQNVYNFLLTLALRRWTKFSQNDVYYRVTAKTQLYETRTRTITGPSTIRQESYYAPGSITAQWDNIIVGTQETNQVAPRPPPEYIGQVTTTSQKYRIIDPVRYTYKNGKRVPAIRYYSVRYLTPSQVASFTGRGYVVEPISQNTPLSPRTVYGPSAVERAQVLKPQIALNPVTDTTEPSPSLSIDWQGSYGRRNQPGRSVKMAAPQNNPPPLILVTKYPGRKVKY